jgi:hypothetical protein
MRSDEFFLGKAAECDRNAILTKDPDMRGQWRKMADDWRALVKQPLRSPVKD